MDQGHWIQGLGTPRMGCMDPRPWIQGHGSNAQNPRPWIPRPCIHGTGSKALDTYQRLAFQGILTDELPSLKIDSPRQNKSPKLILAERLLGEQAPVYRLPSLKIDSPEKNSSPLTLFAKRLSGCGVHGPWIQGHGSRDTDPMPKTQDLGFQSRESTALD